MITIPETTISNILESIDYEESFYPTWNGWTVAKREKMINYIVESFFTYFSEPCIPVDDWTSDEYETFERAVAYQILYVGSNSGGLQKFIAEASTMKVDVLTLTRASATAVVPDTGYDPMSEALLESLCMVLKNSNIKFNLVVSNE